MCMDFSQFKDIPVIDCHVHLWMLRESINETAQADQLEALEEIISETGLSQMYIFSGWGLPELQFKIEKPGHYYAGAYVPWSNRTGDFKIKDWDEYIREVKSKGFDGYISIEHGSHHPPYETAAHEIKYLKRLIAGEFWRANRVK